MFLSWAKNKVSKWIKNPANKRRAARWLLPLVVYFLRSIATRTETQIDDRLIDQLDAWSRHI